MPNRHAAAVDLASLLDGSSAGELIPELARNGLQQLIQLELAAFLGADRHERTEERLGYRNGYRPRTLTTQVGDLELLIPKLRTGSFLPSILEPRRRGSRIEGRKPPWRSLGISRSMSPTWVVRVRGR